MTNAAIDRAIEFAAPVYAAPHGQALTPLNDYRKRYVVAQNGVFLEYKNPLLHASVKVAQGIHTMPYGIQHEFITLIHGGIPAALLKQAIYKAKRALPNEWAAWIIYDDIKGYVLKESHESYADAGHIQYHLPDDISRLVVDIHSHGTMDAFFSHMDDHDERYNGGVHFSLVLGHCHKDIPQMAWRFSIDGTFIQLPGNITPFESIQTELEKAI